MKLILGKYWAAALKSPLQDFCSNTAVNVGLQLAAGSSAWTNTRADEEKWLSTGLCHDHVLHQLKIIIVHLICCQRHVPPCNFFVSPTPPSLTLGFLLLQLFFVTLTVAALDQEGGTSGLIRSDNELLALIYSFMLIWLTFHFSTLSSSATDRVGRGSQ